MRAILLSTLALGALTSAALADGPLMLTDEQMDKVTAGTTPPLQPGLGRMTSAEVRDRVVILRQVPAEQAAVIFTGGGKVTADQARSP